LSDAKPKLEQFAMDAWSTPKLVLRAHLPDQRAQFYLDSRAPSSPPRFPTPIVAKAGPMPPHQRFRLDNRNDLQDRSVVDEATGDLACGTGEMNGFDGIAGFV
jgi:hypothetical protein